MFIKKLLLSAALIIGVVAAGFAQTPSTPKTGDTSGDYTLWIGEDGNFAYFYAIPTIIKSNTGAEEEKTRFAPTALKGDLSVDLYALAPGYIFNSATTKVSYIVDGDKSTFRTYKADSTWGNGGVTITNSIIAYSDTGYAKGKRYLFIKVTDGTKTIVLKVSLLGFPTAAKVIGEISKAQKAINEDPFGGEIESDDPFGEEEFTVESFSASVANLNPFDLEGYVAAFVEFAARNDVDVSYIYDYEIDLEFMTYAQAEEVKESTIAYTDALDRDKVVHIVVNPIHWAAASPAKRVAVMFHELGHDILNFKHASDEGPLMSVYAREDYTIEDVFELTTEMLNDFKNGVEYNHEEGSH